MKSLILKLALANGLLFLCWQSTAQPAPKIHEQVRQSRTFREPIVWIGDEAPPENESKELLDALSSFKGEGAESALNRLEQFLKTHTGSAWAPSLRAVLAKYYREHGQYTPALEHWEAAWNATKEAKSGSAKEIADFSLVHRARLLASLGRADTLRELFKETEGRPLDRGPLQQIFLSTREALWVMSAFPGRSYRCGTFALNTVATALKLTNDVRELFDLQSPTNGFALSELVRISDRLGLGLIPVRRPNGQELPVPSVVHWKQDHYAAIIAHDGQLYHVIDPTFGQPQWLTASAINSEASGTFMVPAKGIPANWQKMTEDQTDRIFGKGVPNEMDDDKDPPPCTTCPCPPGSAGGPPGSSPGGSPDCPSCGFSGTIGAAMAQWRISEPYINLWVEDEPLGYQPARGERVAFQIHYKQRDQVSHETNWSNVGKSWACSWVGHLDDRGTNTVIMYPPGGGKRYYTPDGTTLEYNSNTRMERTTNGGGNLLGFKVLYANGASDVYGLLLPAATWTNALLTAKITAQGHTNRFEYTNYGNGAVRLLRVIDAQNQTNLIYYVTNHPYTSNLIARVVDPFGRETKLDYASDGLLTNITDVIGITSSFKYDGAGWMTNLTTPYGTTVFQPAGNTNYFGDTPQEVINRSVMITEANGSSKQLYIYYDYGWSLLPGGVRPDYPQDLPDGAPYIDAGNSSFRNSYYWNRQQFAALPESKRTNIASLASDEYKMARIRHWYHSSLINGHNSVAQTLGWEQAPSPTTDPIVMGQTIWYGYPGVTWMGEGSSRQPSLIAEVPNNDTNQPTRFTWNEYDPATYIVTNRITTYSLPNGTRALRTNSFIYASNKVDLLKMIGPNGETEMEYEYDANHRVIGETNAMKYWTRYAFNSDGQVTTVTRSSGLTTTYSYDSKGYLTNVADAPIGRSESFTYDTNGLVRTHTDALGLTKTNTWDKLQRLTSVADANGYISNVYTHLDLTATRDKLGNWRYFGYNQLRQKTGETNELGNATVYGFCECGSPNLIRDALTNITTFNYDLNGRMTNAVYPGGLIVNNTYNLLGELIRVTDNAGSSITNAYNNQGLLVAASNAFGRVQSVTYDIEDRATTNIDANGIAVVSTFDNLGRLLSRTYPDTGVERFQFSTTNAFAGPIVYTNQLGSVTKYVYDQAGRKTAETNANNDPTQFKYDLAGNLTNLIDGKLQKTFWKYDQFGRVTNKVDHNTSDMFRYVYDPNDRITNRWTPAKGTTKYQYDVAGNLTSITYPTNAAITLQYDALNRLTTMVDAVGTTRYSYTGFGAILSEDGPWENDTVTYGYDTGRRRSGLALQQPNASAWTQSYTHDSMARLATVTSPAGTFTYGYPGSSSFVTNLALPNGARITNSYDNVGRLAATVLINSTNGILDLHTYKYNRGNQRTNTVRTAGDYVDYTYDGIGQLSTAIGREPSGGVRVHERLNYYYDAAGNLTRRDRPTGYGTPFQQYFTNNNLNQLTDVSRTGPLTVSGTVSSLATNVTVNSSNAFLYSDYTFASTNHALVNGTNTFSAVARDNLGRTDTNVATIYSPPSIALSYDANGNLTYDGQKSFEYDDENQLIWLTATNAWRSQFVYDGKFRRRIRREFTWQSGTWVLTNEVRYIYDGNVDIQQRTTFNVPSVTLTRGWDLSGSLQAAGGIGGLLARSDHWSLSDHSCFHSDANGNVTALIDANQNVLARYAYDPFGRVLSMSGPLADANLHRFSSKETHLVSGLVYYLYRYYDPTVQRWANRDPLQESGGANIYGFVENDGINRVDPVGLRIRVPFPKDCNAIDELLKLGQALDSLRRDYKNWRNRGFGTSYKQSRDNSCRGLKNFLNLLQNCCAVWTPQQEKYFALVRNVANTWCSDPPSSTRQLEQDVKATIKDLGVVEENEFNLLDWIVQPIGFDSWSINPRGAIVGGLLLGGALTGADALAPVLAPAF